VVNKDDSSSTPEFPRGSRPFAIDLEVLIITTQAGAPLAKFLGVASQATTLMYRTKRDH
jgi:hypothetical protein